MGHNPLFTLLERWELFANRLDRHWTRLRFRLLWWMHRKSPWLPVTWAEVFLIICVLLGHIGWVLVFSFVNRKIGIAQKWQWWGFVARGIGHCVHYDTAVMIFTSLRTSIWRFITGCSYERSIKYHRWLGNWISFVLSVHIIVMTIWMFYTYTPEQIVDIYFKTDVATTRQFVAGFVGAAGMLLAQVFSWSFFRRNLWTAFQWTHGIFYIMFIVGSLLHFVPYTLMWTLAIATAMFIIDWLTRLYSIFAKPARILSAEVTSDGKIVRMVVRKKHFRFEPGQYVFICIPGLSPLSILEWHPFSISNSPEEAISSFGGGMRHYGQQIDEHPSCHADLTLDIKVLGGWTRRLAKAVQERQRLNRPPNFKILVEGPYGQLMIPLMTKSDYRAILLACGGIGAAPIISLLKSLYERDISRGLLVDPPSPKILFVWASRSREEVRPYEETFHKMIANCPNLEVRVHFTREGQIPVAENDKLAEPTEVIIQQTEACEGPSDIVTPPATPSADRHSFYHSGRPQWNEIFNEMRVQFPLGQMAVATCGPKSMIAELRDQCSNRSGFDFHEETFDF